MGSDTKIDLGEAGFRDRSGSAQVLRLEINASPGAEQRYTPEVLRYSVVDPETHQGQAQALDGQRLNLGLGIDQR